MNQHCDAYRMFINIDKNGNKLKPSIILGCFECNGLKYYVQINPIKKLAE
jgi:hypothetical protein